MPEQEAARHHDRDEQPGAGDLDDRGRRQRAVGRRVASPAADRGRGQDGGQKGAQARGAEEHQRGAESRHPSRFWAVMDQQQAPAAS